MGNITSYIRRVKKTQDRLDAFAAQEYLYALRVAPSCPPSKILHIRGGRSYLGFNYSASALDAYRYRAYTVPDLDADLADIDSVTINVTFDTADYYQFFMLELKTPAVAENPGASDWSFYLHGTGDEFETAGEAEAWLHSEEFQLSESWDHYDIVAFPLCGLVLKNDGTTGIGCNILPVDALNRGRSYIWPRDMRPLQLISA